MRCADQNIAPHRNKPTPIAQGQGFTGLDLWWLSISRQPVGLSGISLLATSRAISSMGLPIGPVSKRTAVALIWDVGNSLALFPRPSHAIGADARRIGMNIPTRPASTAVERGLGACSARLEPHQWAPFGLGVVLRHHLFVPRMGGCSLTNSYMEP